MNRFRLLALAATIAATSFAAKADTIINLNATVPGYQYSNSLAPAFFQTVQLAAGTYNLTAINGVYNGWNQTSPNTNPTWEERIGINTDGSVTFSEINGIAYYSPYPNSDANPFTGLYASASDALAASKMYTFTLATASAVTFYIPDQSTNNPAVNAYTGFTDNTGGVSLQLTAATPEPSSIIMLATGALTTAGMVRRRFLA